MLRFLDFWRARLVALTVALTAGVLCAASGCRLGYEVLELDAAGAAAASSGSPGVSGTEATQAGEGSVSTGGSGGAGSTAGCTLPSNPGASYAVGEAAELAGYYVLRALSSDKCLQTAACGDAYEAVYEQASCSFEACQIFAAVERGSGWYSLQNALSGLCLDPGGPQATSSVVDWSCAPAGYADETRQSFQLVCAGDDTWRLVDRATAAYVTVTGGVADGAPIEFQTALGGDEQRFSLEARSTVFEAVVPTSESEPGELWRYSTRRPKAGWEQTTFDDSAWSEGPGGFGDGIAVSSPRRTAWTEADIWLRRTFTLDSLPDALDLRVNHDHAAEVYINGVEAAVLPNWTSGYRQWPLSDVALASLVVGTNVIAVHCTHDNSGEQFIDLGLGRFSW